MGVITDAASAEISRRAKKLYGEVLTRPALLVSDGLHQIYSCDVNIGPVDVSGTINHYNKQDRHGKEKTDRKGQTTANLLSGLPMQRPEDWNLDDSLPGHVDTTMHNVPLSRANHDLIYADIGAAVYVERTESGQWQVGGFSQERPGTHFMYEVDLGNMVLGSVIDLSIESRLLTLAEIGELRPFGQLAFGAAAIYQGGELLRLT